jgi:stage II sporulation protein D
MSHPSGSRPTRVLNRRSFIASISAIAASPLLLSGCSSQVITSDLPMPNRGPMTPGPETPVAAGSPTIRRPVPQTRPPLPISEPLVRVRLTQADFSRGGLRAGSGWMRVHQPVIGRAGRMLKGPVEVSVSSRGWVVQDSSGVRLNFDGLDTLELAAVADQPQRVQLDGQTYPGTLRLISRSDIDLGIVDVVNHVMMEQYLPGVIAKELYNNWKPHTHLAQAVAARAYAASEIAFWSSRRHFDVVAGQASQAYVGGAAHRISNEAVQQTRGQLLAYDNLLVTAYYSSCCGGRSASAADAFGEGVINDIAPLQARSLNECCRWAPVFSWKVERPTVDVSRRLTAWASDRGEPVLSRFVDVASVEPAAVYANGRAVRFLLRDSKGQTAELPAERFREAMNFSERGLGSPKSSLKSADVAANLSGRSFVFRGRGFGHGVGLCQHGAEAQARQGTDYRTILTHYYPGATITKAYG